MALYSTWDWDRNSYRVYASRRPASVGDDPVPPRPSNLSALGADPDSDVKALPSGVRFMGYSHIPRGEIRREPGGLGDSGDDAGSAPSRWPMVVLGAVAGAGVMHWWMRRSR